MVGVVVVGLLSVGGLLLLLLLLSGSRLLRWRWSCDGCWSSLSAVSFLVRVVLIVVFFWVVILGAVCINKPSQPNLVID
jgi:hypothetical protein